MVREEVISSAVSFLQDPSVTSAPLEKKIAFLQSKNLTQEEIDTALSRAGEGSSSGAGTPPSSNGGRYSHQQQPIFQPALPPQNQGYGYGQTGTWQPSPPPDLPKRDWRDWFIMATMMGGVGYGLYFVAKRYIMPLISPPTPPQLQQDKQSIDEQFSRAFALLDQLSADTALLKSTEEKRTEHLDAVLREVENVVSELKSSSRRRDDETRRIGEEVRSLKDGIPKAIEGAREGNEKRLKELGTELRSLKVLLGNRLGSTGAATSPPSMTRNIVGTSPPGTTQPNDDASTGRSFANGAAVGSQLLTTNPPATAAPQSSSTPVPRDSSAGPFSQLGKPAAIPAWQMAAASKSKGPTVSMSGDKANGTSADVTEDLQPSAPAS